MNIDISVVVPALNEEANINKTIEDLLNAFRKLKINGEIIVVNDGSTDGTKTIIKSFMDKYTNIRLINHKEPKGIGKAYWIGAKASRSKALTWVPGDGENDAYEILRYLPLLDHVDIVVPYAYNKEIRGPFRNYLSKLYKGIINLSFGMILNYMNGMVIFRRSILQDVKLNSSGFFFMTELLIKTIKHGYLYAEVPYALKKRGAGDSKALSVNSLIKVIFGYTRMLLSVYFTKNSNKNIHPDSITYLRKSYGVAKDNSNYNIVKDQLESL